MSAHDPAGLRADELRTRWFAADKELHAPLVAVSEVVCRCDGRGHRHQGPASRCEILQRRDGPLGDRCGRVLVDPQGWRRPPVLRVAMRPARRRPALAHAAPRRRSAAPRSQALRSFCGRRARLSRGAGERELVAATAACVHRDHDDDSCDDRQCGPDPKGRLESGMKPPLDPFKRESTENVSRAKGTLNRRIIS
jgi:hypothetical protein